MGDSYPNLILKGIKNRKTLCTFTPLANASFGLYFRKIDEIDRHINKKIMKFYYFY